MPAAASAAAAAAANAPASRSLTLRSWIRNDPELQRPSCGSASLSSRGSAAARMRRCSSLFADLRPIIVGFDDTGGSEPGAHASAA
eukprot:69199-Chlamydomonas_euryale.AAC.1